MPHFRFLPALCCLFLWVALPTHAQDDAFTNPQSGLSKEIFSIISAKQHPYLKQTNIANRADDLDALYKRNNYELLWLGQSNSAKNTADALDLLANADSHGLMKTNYDVDALRQKYHEALDLNPSSYRELAHYDTAISIALLRYLHDMHYGRVNPKGINYNLQLRVKKIVDLPALIKDSVTLNTVSQLPLLVEPKLQQYQKLKVALTNYRALAEKSPHFQFIPQGKKLRPGGKHPQLHELRQYLSGLGDMIPSNGSAKPALTAINSPSKPVKTANVTAVSQQSPTYGPDLVEGMIKFQLRHGLGADGTIGPGTVAALNEPLAKRITQIELALERLRWLPEMNANRSIIVNIPAFQLWAIDELKDVDGITNMRVVVGKSIKNQTPVLMANMSFLEFMPYWNVPRNILNDEILPKIARNPGFLPSQNMEIVSNHGKPVAFNGSAVENLKKGIYRVRQKPGNRNSLGKVKFIFPNKDDVYLHDTPSSSLFNRTRRDFSHGCVRVEKPLVLAEFALKNQGNWNTEAIKKAMRSATTRRVDLKQPIPVLFFYTTSFVDQHNNLAFYPDIYGHDAVLMEALKKPDDLSDQTIFMAASVAPTLPPNPNPKPNSPP